jgi:4-amino-4-deoxy-L-arabinose transferase-like glycosyltransferase
MRCADISRGDTIRDVLAPLTYLIAAALMLRLVGVARDLLPGSGVLALLLATVHVIGVSRRRPHLPNWWNLAKDHAFELSLLAICALALAVRLPGFAGDLGHMPLDIDEHRFASTVKHYFVTGELLHDTVEHYPGAVFWLFSAASFLTFLRGLTTGDTTAASALPVETYVQAARLANIWVAVAIVAMTGFIGRRVAGQAVGLLSAALVAIVPLSIDVTVQARNDPGMVLAAVATTLAALVYYDSDKRAWIVVAAVLAGMAGAIKYSAVFALVPVMIAWLTRTPVEHRLKMCVFALAAFVATVAVTNHFIWADFPNFLRQLSDQVAITGRGHWNATDNPARFYLGTLVGLGPGWPVVILAAGFTV